MESSESEPTSWKGVDTAEEERKLVGVLNVPAASVDSVFFGVWERLRESLLRCTEGEVMWGRALAARCGGERTVVGR